VQGIRVQHFWGFPLYHPAFFGISTLPTGTIRDPTLPPAGRKNDAFQRFNRYRKQKLSVQA